MEFVYMSRSVYSNIAHSGNNERTNENEEGIEGAETQACKQSKCPSKREELNDGPFTPRSIT